jgi:hypothetical protein
MGLDSLIKIVAGDMKNNFVQVIIELFISLLLFVRKEAH